MSNIEHESTSNMEERCQELIIVARQWEEQMTDLRLYTEIEKETLENEISCLLSKNEQEKQSLENSLMQLEEERVSLSVLVTHYTMSNSLFHFTYIFIYYFPGADLCEQ